MSSFLRGKHYPVFCVHHKFAFVYSLITYVCSPKQHMDQVCKLLYKWHNTVILWFVHFDACYCGSFSF